VSNVRPPPCGNDGAGLSHGDITQERGASIVESHIFLLQPSTSRPEHLHIRVGGLVHSHAGVVGSQVDSPHDGTGQAVCNEIGLASNMLNVHGELVDVGELLLLAGEPRLSHFGHGKRQWFMVHKRCEPPALQQGKEVANGEVKAEELSVESAVLPFDGAQLAAEERDGCQAPHLAGFTIRLCLLSRPKRVRRWASCSASEVLATRMSSR